MIMLTPDNQLEAFALNGMLFVLNLTKKLILHIQCTEPVPFVLSTVKIDQFLGQIKPIHKIINVWKNFMV